MSVLDYTSLKRNVSFQAGSKTGDKQCFTIDIVNDGIREDGNESFFLTLINPEPMLSDVAIRQSNVTVIIADCKFIKL